MNLSDEAARLAAIDDTEPWPRLHRELAAHEAMAGLVVAEIRARQAKEWDAR